VSRLKEKVAVVTGAANGIGEAIALRFAAEGARVVIADKDDDGAQRVRDEIHGHGGTAATCKVNVGSPCEVQSMLRLAERQFGTPTVLVTCAGIAIGGCASGPESVLQLSEEEWQSVLTVNLSGTFYCAQAMTRMLLACRTPGSLITVSSIAATRPTMDRDPAYHASKGGVVSLTRSLAVKLAAHGIRVNSLCPGYVLTDLTRDGLEEPEIWNAVHSRIPMGTMGDPSDLAGAAVFLATDESSYMTGQEICVDGGTTILGWTPAERHLVSQ
jgi:glucose 1-dehydrogenase